MIRGIVIIFLSDILPILLFQLAYDYYVNTHLHCRINSPYQTMEFSGFPFPEGSASYVTGTCYYEYLKAFAKKFDLMKNIQVRVKLFIYIT